MPLAEVYARIENGKVVEYPVTHHQIVLRKQSVNLYYPCQFEKMPVVPNFHFVVEELRVRKDYIDVTYIVKPIALSILLNRIDEDTNAKTAIALRIRYLIVKYVKDQLDKYAMGIGFPSMAAACNHKNTFDKDKLFLSRKCQKVNDRIIALICQYERNVENGTMSILSFYNRIEAETVKLQIPEAVEETTVQQFNPIEHGNWFQPA